MQRAAIGFLTAALVSGCVTTGEVKHTVVIAGQVCCAKHRIPLITVRGFEAKPLTLVHSADPSSPQCDERTPNRIWDRQHLVRTSLHPVRHVVTYCPRCDAEYTDCLADWHLSDSDTQQITALVSRRHNIRKPIIRIVAVDKNRALVDAGHEARVADIFDEFGVTKREETWQLSSSIGAHTVIATGQLPR
jgi:hypothetical protein